MAHIMLGDRDPRRIYRLRLSLDCRQESPMIPTSLLGDDDGMANRTTPPVRRESLASEVCLVLLLLLLFKALQGWMGCTFFSVIVMYKMNKL